MVFCTCKKSTQPSPSSPSTKPSRTLFSLRRSTPPLAHITTDLDPTQNPPYTTSQLRQFKSAKVSKRHVDSVLYRNRHSARKTLLTKDGVVSFSGFVDWFSRKKLKEAHERGERYDSTQNEEEQGESGGVPLMISRVKRIDPVKSGFMGKKSERDERMGCAAGRFVDDKWKQPPQQEQRVQSSGGVVTPLKKGDTESSSATTVGCSPLGSVGSSSSPSNNNNDTTKEEEEGWCDVFNTSTMSGDTSTSLTPEKEPIEDYSRDVGDEGSAWYNVFQSSSVVVAGEEEEENVVNTNNDENGKSDQVNEGREEDEAEKIRGIRNIEVVYTEPKKSMLKRVSTWKRSKKDSSYGQLQ